MKQVLLVFLGGGVGSVLRYLVAHSFNPLTEIPLGTLAVNVIGSFIIGFLIGLGSKNGIFSSNSSLLLVTGFCGGFTTFSAFAFENQELLKAGQILDFGIYTLLSLVLGIGAVFFGLFISKFL
ncbi:MAG TPA: fluoride efflux transporter CrcB [Salinimicrobium sp.]|nr:fluoride efflux transporter CrcB [Salinimicrobium sp.]